MYVFTDNAFLSIVSHSHDERLLEVRGKCSGDIERTFPEAEVARSEDEEYPYSASIARDRVADRIALRVKHVGYRKFNPTAEEPWRQTMYRDVEEAIRKSAP